MHSKIAISFRANKKQVLGVLRLQISAVFADVQVLLKKAVLLIHFIVEIESTLLLQGMRLLKAIFNFFENRMHITLPELFQ